MQEIHSFWPGETVIVVAEVCPVSSEWHAPTEEFDGFIPLHHSDKQK